MSQLSHEYRNDETGYSGDEIRHRHQATGKIRCNVYVIRQETRVHSADASHRDRHQHNCFCAIAPDIRYLY